MEEEKGPGTLLQELDKQALGSTLDELVTVCRDWTASLDSKSCRLFLNSAREALAQEVLTPSGQDGQHSANEKSPCSPSDVRLTSRNTRGRKTEAVNALLQYDLARLAQCKASRLSFQEVSDIFVVTMPAQVESGRDSRSKSQVTTLAASVSAAAEPELGKSCKTDKARSSDSLRCTGKTVAESRDRVRDWHSEAENSSSDSSTVALWRVIDDLQAQVSELRTTCQDQNKRIVEQEKEAAALRNDILRLQGDVVELRGSCRADFKMQALASSFPLANENERARSSELDGQDASAEQEVTLSSRRTTLSSRRATQSEDNQGPKSLSMEAAASPPPMCEMTVPARTENLSNNEPTNSLMSSSLLMAQSTEDPGNPAPANWTTSVGHQRRNQNTEPPGSSSELDDTNDWIAVCAPQRKTALFVGGLQKSISSEQLTDFIRHRARKKVTVFNCYIHEPKLDQQTTYAHIVVDRPSAAVLLSKGFWPGRGYCRRWHFPKRDGISRPRV